MATAADPARLSPIPPTADAAAPTRAPHRPASVERALPVRSLLLLPAGLTLIAGLLGGIGLLDIGLDARLTGLRDVHGPLMVLGFLGTLIALERAVAARVAWGYAAPLLTGLGALVTIPPDTRAGGAVLLTAGLLTLVLVYGSLWRRSRDDLVLVQAAAAGCAVLAAVLWPRTDVATALPWLVGFVVLTIAAERVELARLAIRHGPGILVGLTTAYLLAATLTLLWPRTGSRLLALTLLGLTGWLALSDVARRTIRLTGQARFSAAALLTAYLWLAVGSLTWLSAGPIATTDAYDTVVHAVFLGFAMSMVLAHAPVILPAVIRRPLPYRPLFWLPFVVLHAGLAVRLALGHGIPSEPVWRAGALVTVLALLLLPVVLVAAVVRARSTSHRRPTT